jgi:hypothetical protein
MLRKDKESVDSGWQSSARGEQAWKEATDKVASRNADVCKTGRRERADQERERADERRSAAAKREAKLRGKPGS